MGWIQLAVGCLGVLAYNVTYEVDTNFYKYWGAVEQAQGTVTGWHKTKHVYQPASKPKKYWHDWYEVSFQFETSDGKIHQGASYAVKPAREGSQVQVEYPAGQPELARAKGGARDTTSGWGVLANGAVLLLVFNGLLMILAGLRTGLRQLERLHQGKDDAPDDPDMDGKIEEGEELPMGRVLLWPALGLTGLVAFVTYWVR